MRWSIQNVQVSKELWEGMQQMYIWPVIISGSEIWAVNKRDDKCIKAFEV